MRAVAKRCCLARRGAAFFLGDVGHLMLSGEVAFEDLHEVVRETEEVRLHLLRDGGTGPGAFGTEFIFEFVEHFFDVPAAQVEEGDHAGGQRKFAGEELIFLPGRRVRVADPPKADLVDRRDEFISGDAVVVAVGAVEGVFAGERQVHFFLGEGDKVDAAALFPFLPLGVVDAGAVVGVEDFTTGGGVLAQSVLIEAFEGVHIVFLFALRVREVGERLGAQVEGEEVADGAFRTVDRHRVDGGPVPVTVGGVEIEVTQAVEVGEGIVGEQLGDTGTGLAAELQTAGAF